MAEQMDSPPVVAHSRIKDRCLNCVEHGAPFDGPCDGCGYADPRWCPPWMWAEFNAHHAARHERTNHHG